nr:vitellogenin-2-like [Pogona vitticeps]
MRGIVLALLLTLAGSQKFPNRDQKTQNKGLPPGIGTETLVPRPVFEDGRAYLFDYEGAIQSTVHGDDLGESTMKIHAKIAIYGQSREHVLRIKSIELEEAVGFHSRQEFHAPPKQPEELTMCTQYSYYFEYDGKIKAIHVSNGIPVLCVNLVRGVLNMMHVTLEKQITYEVQETGLHGDCPARYVIQEDKDRNVIVAKATNLNNCNKKIVRNLGMSYINVLPNCTLSERMVQGTTSYVMTLKRLPGRTAQITEVEAQQVFQVSPISEADGAGVMRAWQRLSLIDEPTQEVPDVEQKGKGEQRRTVDIYYEFPEDLPQMIINVGEPENRVEEILEELDRLSDIPVEALPKYTELIQQLRRLNLKSLQKLFKNFEERPKARQALLLGIIYAGNSNTLKFIRDKVVKEELPTNELYWVVPITLHFANPDISKVEETARMAAEIVEKFSTSRSFWLQKLIFLAHGSLTYKQCSQVRSCPNKFLEPIHNYLNEAIREGNENRMILGMKTIGNTALADSLKIIKPLTESGKYSLYVQAVAVQTLMRIGKQNPELVQRVLLPIYMNDSRSVIIRKLACMGLLENNPQPALVTVMATAALNDSNMDFVSFVYCQMKAWSNVRIPAYLRLARACRLALKLMDSVFDRVKYQYSKVVYLSIFNSLHRIGFLGKWFLIDDPRSMFLSNIVLKTEAFFSGTMIQPFEFALHAEGIKEWLWQQNFPFDKYSTHQKIKDTEAKFPDFKHVPLQKPLLSASLRVLGQEQIFFTPDELMHIMKLGGGKLYSAEAWQMVYLLTKILDVQTTQILNLEVRQIQPCSLGLPVEVSANGIVMVQAAVKVKTVDSLGERLETRLDSKIILQGRGKFFWGVNTGFSQHIVEMTAKFRTQGALKLNATLDKRTKNLRVDIEPFHDRFELGLAGHEAHVVARYPHTEKKAPVLPEAPEIDILNEEFKSRRSDTQQKSEFYKSRPEDRCFRFAAYPMKICFETVKKTKDVVSVRKTWLHMLCEAHEMRTMLITDVAVDKISCEFQQDHEIPRSKREVRPDEDESPYEAEKAGSRTLKKIYKDEKGQDRKPFRKPESSSSSSTDETSSSSSSSSQKLQEKRKGDSIAAAAATVTAVAVAAAATAAIAAAVTAVASDSSSSDSSSSDSSSSSSGSSDSSSSDSSSSDSSSSSSGSSDSSSSDSSSSDSSSSSSGSSDSSSSDSSSSSSDSSSSDSSSSDDSSSSESDQISEKGDKKDIYMFSFRSVKQQKQQPSGKQRPTSSSSSSDNTVEEYDDSSSGSSSSSSSEEDIKDSSLELVLHAHLHFICHDKKQYGLDVVIYKGLETVQMTVKDINRPNKPIAVFKAVMPNPHKVVTSLTGIWDSRDYRFALETETGWFADYPALRWKLDYPRIPPFIANLTEPIVARIPGVAYMLGFLHKVQRNPANRITLVFALTGPRSYAVVLKLPTEGTVYAEDCMLPLPVPFRPTVHTSEILDVPSRVLASLNGVCKVEGQTITTFSGETINKGLVSDCFLDLLQDCTCHKKIMVLMKYESANDNNILVNITIGNTEIVFKSRNGQLITIINGTESKLEKLRDGIEDDGIRMVVNRPREGVLDLSVPSLGLRELTYNGHNVMITVTPEMGYTCGLCELYGGESEKLRRPDGSSAMDLVSFAQSWVVSDAEDGVCRLQQTTVDQEES